MSRDWFNIRFGVRHLHIGPWYVRLKTNDYHADNPKWFEIYTVFGRSVERLAVIDLQRYRDYEIDHEPGGWPAIQMKEVTALVDEIEQQRARIKELEHEIKMAKRHLRDVLSERHAIEAALSDERQKTKKLEAEKAELRAELFCNKMCVRYWPNHHVECYLLSDRLKRIQQQADDEGEA